MELYRKIDISTGVFIEDVIADAPSEDLIAVPVPAGFYWPKWDGTQWVEGRTDAEISAIREEQDTQPLTIDERMSAIETNVDEIVTVLAAIEGVTV